ncbi:hypothetical protein [Polyangium aurulentum]|uniref:hypothetical protein n=1 Tax=Polyangium aurulentum TaxID=2567896 RepID=UPI0010AE100B|nr:hypothetical protein [Polyangium aurulentum]UQA59639.1 hypothetical protein E8A73_003795 [Polyangium aurulentum]
MTNKNDAVDVQKLLLSAEEEGALSAEALAALAAADLGAQIQAGLGVAVDDVEASEVVLVTVMPDDSGSIAAAGNTQAVREGHNAVIEALAASKQKDGILAHTRYLNGHVLYPYRPVAQAERMTAKNYDPSLGTPLYDQTVVLLGTVIAKAQAFAQSGVPARSVTLIITDGADAGSYRSKASDVKAIVRDMLAAEQHIVAAMGIDDGSTPFRDVFRAMGIEDRWILTPRSDASEIRKAFRMFSQSAMRASQQGGGFSRTAAGGFLGP